MSLENLLKTRQLEPHETNARQVGKQLNAICRSLEDARQETITPETRLEAAYRAIMQLSMLALWANVNSINIQRSLGSKVSKKRPANLGGPNLTTLIHESPVSPGCHACASAARRSAAALIRI